MRAGLGDCLSGSPADRQGSKESRREMVQGLKYGNGHELGEERMVTVGFRG